MYMKTTGQPCELNPSDRLELIHESFAVVAKCAALLRENNANFEEHALDLFITNLGARLVEIGLRGDKSQQAELQHWRDHGVERCQQLIDAARERGGVITWGDVHTMWLKPPAPGIFILDQMKKIELNTPQFDTEKA
jgi:hypothetical protein